MSAMDEVDSIMAELGINKDPKQETSLDEVDALMAEIGLNTNNGVGRGVSGPGRGMSGPGRGISGPGRGMAGPGRGVSGPGRGLGPVAPPPATHTPDGRPIHYNGPPCANCGEMIIGPCVNAIGKQYHPEHFVCASCNNPFPNGVFIEFEGNAYCEFDYNNLFLPRCANCQQPITDKCVNAGGKQFHPHHFTCTGCGKNLVGQAYKVEEGEVYCNVCREARKKQIAPPADTCSRCKQPITGEWIILHGQKMHAEHFRCESCGCEFRGGNCHEYEGKLYCTEDYNKLQRNVCASCHKPILGRSITALGRVWHPEHFVCAVCHEPFSGSNFYEKDGKPYCDIHYAQEFGKLCGKCNRPVVKDSVIFLDKHYHPEHFVCSGCDKALAKGNITEWESKPMCMACYGKLPKEVRKKYEKKREMEKKAAEKKAKEEKKAREKEGKK